MTPPDASGDKRSRERSVRVSEGDAAEGVLRPMQRPLSA